MLKPKFIVFLYATFHTQTVVKHLTETLSMIWTDEEFKEEALVFWNKNWKYLNEDYPFDIESMTYEYVRNNKDFKYKDHVEAGVLVTCLADYGYIEFTKRENNIRYHSLTEKGLNFIKEKNQ